VTEALTLLKVAIALFPPLASLLEKALDAIAGHPATPDEAHLYALVRATLPEKSASAEAARKLGGGA
jgi:hypothetical protein